MSRIFSAFLLCFSLFSFSSQGADSNAYLVESVQVNVTEKSPTLARNTAVATARRDAFLILLTRLEMNIKIADDITDEEISDMVRSEQIENEQLAGNSYSANFNIMFAKDFVDHILSQKKLTNPENASGEYEESYLLVPAKMLKRRPILWEENNDWKKAVEKNLSKKSQTKFLIPDGDVQNIAILNRENVTLIDYAGLEPLLSRYKSDAAYMLFFSYDEIENKVIIDVSYIRKLQKKQFKLSFVNVDRLSYETLLEKVAQKTVDYLANSQTGNGKVATSNVVQLGVYIGSLGNWLMIKNKIENSNLISQMNIEAISRDYALISVNYTDSRTDIIEAFSRIGISLDKKSENFYTLNAN